MFFSFLTFNLKLTLSNSLYFNLTNYLGPISISTACFGWDGYGFTSEDGLATRGGFGKK